MDYYTYFMLRLRRADRAAASDAIAGTIQQLTSAEKQTFNDAGELVELLLTWSAPPSTQATRRPGTEQCDSALTPAGGES